MRRSPVTASSATLLSLGILASAFALGACSDDDGGDAAGAGASSSSASSTTGSGGSGASGGAGGSGASGSGGGGNGGEGGAYQKLQIQFEARIGAEPFACGQTYAGVGPAATTVTPVDMKMYIRDVKLIRKDGSGSDALELEQDGVWQHQNVTMLDFEDATDRCTGGTPETNTTVTGTAPAGDYLGLEFTIGVPAELNHLDVTAAPSPLNYMGLYWSWAMGRIYWSTLVESVPGDGVGVPTAIHFGSTGCAGNPEQGDMVTCLNANSPVLSFADFDPATSKVVIDVAELLAHTDVAVGAQCHSFPGNEACAMPLSHAGVDYATGGTMPGQTVFSVE